MNSKYVSYLMHCVESLPHPLPEVLPKLIKLHERIVQGYIECEFFFFNSECQKVSSYRIWLSSSQFHRLKRLCETYHFGEMHTFEEVALIYKIKFSEKLDFEFIKEIKK